MSRLARRSWIRRFALGVAGCAVPGRQWRQGFLLEASADGAPESAGVRVSLSEFPALLQDFGSVRLTVNPVGPDHFPQGDLYPFLVNRCPGGLYKAMSAECLHAHCVVDSYDDLAEGIRCPCHGSVYGIDGVRLFGPAPEGSVLRPFPISRVDADTLRVEVPGFAFSAKATPVPASPSSRLRLRFPVHPNVTYEVRRTDGLGPAREPVMFALAADAPLDQTCWTPGDGDPPEADLYVAAVGRAGFFEIAMVLQEA
jgi:nitrite reductase/ring-hydroxylating ferredoxin subunit